MAIQIRQSPADLTRGDGGRERLDISNNLEENFMEETAGAWSFIAMYSNVTHQKSPISAH